MIPYETIVTLSCEHSGQGEKRSTQKCTFECIRTELMFLMLCPARPVHERRCGSSMLLVSSVPSSSTACAKGIWQSLLCPWRVCLREWESSSYEIILTPPAARIAS